MATVYKVKHKVTGKYISTEIRWCHARLRKNRRFAISTDEAHEDLFLSIERINQFVSLALHHGLQKDLDNYEIEAYTTQQPIRTRSSAKLHNIVERKSQARLVEKLKNGYPNTNI